MLNKYKTILILIIFLGANIIPTISGNENLINNKYRPGIYPALNIDHLSTVIAKPGDTVTIYGTGFGSIAGYIVLTGLKINADSWSDNEIVFTVPENSASGFIYVRDVNLVKSNSLSFSLDRVLPDGQFEPYGFQLEDTGLSGAAFLVETDGSYFYGITGFETLCTYKILGDDLHSFCSRIYLPQKVSDLKVYNGYLYLSGDMGLIVYRCIDLQNNNPNVIMAIAGSSYMTLDIKEKNGSPINGALLALCEYRPVLNTNELRTPLYKIDSEELEYLGSYSRTVADTERYHTIAIDPLNPKIYVSGYITLLGNDKYILELDISNVDDIILNYRLELGGILAFDMDAKDDILWTGVVASSTERYLVYNIKPGTEHLSLAQTVTGNYRLGRATRVKIIDDSITVGSSWSGERPDVYLLDTFNSGDQPLASADSLDWAFDVTGYSIGSQGKIIVADEWGGFITYTYLTTPSYSLSHDQDYNWVVSSAMTQEIYLTSDRLFLANRGAGVWSADRYDLSDESSWKYVDWEWSESKPQPHPISALCVREDATYGTLIAALGHEKAMAWGTYVYGILYRETDDDIEFMAISDEIEPPGLYSKGISVIWPETDLTYMVTGTDGFRAYVVNPDAPSIEIHKDCLTKGFGSDDFNTNNIANCMVYYDQKIIIGSSPGLLIGDPTLFIYDVSYPEGIPDRNHPDRKITVTESEVLNCVKYKTINHIDLTPSGLIVLSTSQGVAVLDISWIPELNKMTDAKAWDLIKIPVETYLPWWNYGWSTLQADARFFDDSTLYVVKNPRGIWKIDIEINNAGYTHNSKPSGFYPGVQCGIDYNQLLENWQNPDIITMHHPYGLIVDNNGIYVHGWSGKVNALSFSITNNCPSKPTISGPATGEVGTSIEYTFSSNDPEGNKLLYYIDWGDGNIENWDGPHNSGQNVKISHTWTRTGTFQIKAKVKDENNGVSYWGSQVITMPRTKNTDNNLLYQLFKVLANLLPLIKNLINLIN